MPSLQAYYVVYHGMCGVADISLSSAFLRDRSEKICEGSIIVPFWGESVLVKPETISLDGFKWLCKVGMTVLLRWPERVEKWCSVHRMCPHFRSK